jgi:phage terminase Nu1 subunit (DNA packaging protein)
VRLKRGELLEASAVSREWCAMMRQISAAVLAVTSRLRQQLPGLSATDVLTIDRELRSALTDVAEERATTERLSGAVHAV